MESENLYISVKRRICKLIFDGEFSDGMTTPPERILAEILGVSRVTLRKALQLLEDDGVVERVQGSGTKVRFNIEGHAGTLDIITLVAPAQNPFFSSFIDAFQQNSEAHDSLVLYKQKPAGEPLEDCLFKLYQKDLRNVVIWPDDLKIDMQSLKKLRGLGMNLVLFDVRLKTPYADCVFLDNYDAISRLCVSLRSRGAQSLGYIGWDNKEIWSVVERESAFTKLEPQGRILLSVPWSGRESLGRIAETFAAGCQQGNKQPNAIIFGDGEIGIAFAKAFSAYPTHVVLGAVDEFPGAEELSLTTCAQDFGEISQRTYHCLYKQSYAAKEWKASDYPVTGHLIESN